MDRFDDQKTELNTNNERYVDQLFNQAEQLSANYSLFQNTKTTP